jgi:hypothetical protein
VNDGGVITNDKVTDSQAEPAPFTTGAPTYTSGKAVDTVNNGDTSADHKTTDSQAEPAPSATGTPTNTSGKEVDTKYTSESIPEDTSASSDTQPPADGQRGEVSGAINAAVRSTSGSYAEQKNDVPEASPQDKRSIEQPKDIGTNQEETSPGFLRESDTDDGAKLAAEKESNTTPKSRNADITQQPVGGEAQTPDAEASRAISAEPSAKKQGVEEQNMMDDFMARGAENVSLLDSVAAENDLEITQNDSGMNIIDIASAPNGEVTIGGAMYKLVGDRFDDTGESIGQLFYDKTSDNYTSVEYGKVVNWGDSNPNKKI